LSKDPTPQWPNPDELRRDMEDFFKHKYGDRVQLGIMNAHPDQARTAEEGTETKEAPLDLSFDYLPRDIKNYLDRYVIKQDGAKKVLATAICDHYNHIKRCSSGDRCREYAKQNIIMLGPTGVGKTYLVRTIAELIGVPFVKADATKFSETGYVGGDVEDLVRELVQKADGNIRLAEYGIIYLDEIDKIATPSNLLGRDVSGGGVQRGLLKLMEETEVALRTPYDLTSQLQAAMEFQSKGKVTRSVINTRHILFIVSGAFGGLVPIIRKRIGAQNIGFRGGAGIPLRDEDFLSKVKSTDFIEYGFESEFVGRLPVVVACHELGIEDLFQILKHSEGSIVRQYVQAFEAYGIDVVFRDDGLHRLAEKAHLEQTGARSLVSVCERTFREFKYHLPHSTVRKLEVTEELVDFPARVLEQALQASMHEQVEALEVTIDRIAKSWSDRNGIEIHIQDEAAMLLAQKSIDTGKGVEEVFAETFRNYEHGLSLIRRTQGVSHFEITPDVIRNPAGTLENWIRSYYVGEPH
jgi:ATP-dependent Clp protease ATP-binding subunit ClpX